MLGNIIDHRTDRVDPNIDAVFEPAAHDDQRRGGTPFFDWAETVGSEVYFAVSWRYGSTVREAVLQAERDWPFPVSVYFYDAGSTPAG